MDMGQQATETGVTMTTKAAPPLAVTTAHIAGINIADWVQWLTLLYIAVMLSHKVWSWHREWKADRKAGESKSG